MAIFKYAYANWEKLLERLKISEHLLILTLRNIFLHFRNTTCVSVKAGESEVIQLCSTIQNVGNKNSCNYCISINKIFFLKKHIHFYC